MKKDKLKKILYALSSPEERQILAFKENETIEKKLSKEISQVYKVFDSHNEARGELIQAINILDDKHEAAKMKFESRMDSSDKKSSDALKEFVSFQIATEKSFEKMGQAIADLEKNHKGFKGESGTSLEKIRKEFLKKIDAITEELERIGDRAARGEPGPIGVGGSRTMYLNGQNISPFDMYGDYNWIAGNNITISSINNTSTKQVDITISSSGSGGGGGYTYKNEVPAGTMDGVNPYFILAHTPTDPAGMQLFLNGALQYQDPGGDFTITGPVITFLTDSIPQSGGILLAFYS